MVPFNLTYGAEAVIPLEIGIPSPRIMAFNEASNSAQLRANLDLIDEVREKFVIQRNAYQHRNERFYNKKVRPTDIKLGDLILWKLAVSNPGQKRKLAQNWEGPYKVSEVVRPGTYRLTDPGGKVVKRPWNAEHIIKFLEGEG